MHDQNLIQRTILLQSYAAYHHMDAEYWRRKKVYGEAVRARKKLQPIALPRP